MHHQLFQYFKSLNYILIILGKKVQKTLQFGQNNQLILGPAKVFIHG
jgi:hypothetical protein